MKLGKVSYQVQKIKDTFFGMSGYASQTSTKRSSTVNRNRSAYKNANSKRSMTHYLNSSIANGESQPSFIGDRMTDL